MLRRSTLAVPVTMVAAALAGTAGVVATSDPAPAQAQSAGQPSFSDVLAQLRRNSKVSERLNAGFFRAPQTRAFVGSAFRPTDSDIAFTADRGDSGLSLDPTRRSNEVETQGQGNEQKMVIKEVPQTRGTFEIPLDIPNRAEVVSVEASYRDAAGGGGMGFSVVKLGRLGDGADERLQLPSGADPAAGFPSTDNATHTNARLPLKDGKFRVDNSRNRYVLRVHMFDTNPETRFFGYTIQYVIGVGVPGAPTG